ncbi:MAG: PorV/PorQ family protein [candidate division KSB1 bacterium]|nr:PorV/PorQ family protein [candidate division KSB1 bacterium]
MKKLTIMLLTAALTATAYGQNRPFRVGTTAANFLEMGIGSAANAMGEAQVAATRDLASIYWNPAGLAYMEKNEIQFSIQPWIAEIKVSFLGAGVTVPRIGVLAIGITGMNYGRTPVTSLDMQEGTGETYAAADYAASFSYARKLAQWFAFGASAKFISSNIWHLNAKAAAMDLGVLVNTHFFAPDGDREKGLAIGMSISNYGMRMRYDGMDLLRPIDILPNQNGNYKDVEGQFRLQSWELPLILRLGVAAYPIATDTQLLTLAVDALHPNNNSESLNLGAEYAYTIPGRGRFMLRVGYRGLYMDKSEYGITFGGGAHIALLGNKLLKLDYAYKDIGLLGFTSTFTVGVTF